MNDIEKIKIDILRDALKDVVDTIRALDRKIHFLVSYNAIFLGFMGTLLFKFDNINEIIKDEKTFFICLSILTFIWVSVFIKIMMNISPYENPTDILKNENDKKFATNIFFISTKNTKLNLDTLVKEYDETINDETTIKKLLYKEIGKLSYIRDRKIGNIRTSVYASFLLTFIFILIIVIFSLLSS